MAQLPDSIRPAVAAEIERELSRLVQKSPSAFSKFVRWATVDASGHSDHDDPRRHIMHVSPTVFGSLPHIGVNSKAFPVYGLVAVQNHSILDQFATSSQVPSDHLRDGVTYAVRHEYSHIRQEELRAFGPQGPMASLQALADGLGLASVWDLADVRKVCRLLGPEASVYARGTDLTPGSAQERWDGLQAGDPLHRVRVELLYKPVFGFEIFSDDPASQQAQRQWARLSDDQRLLASQLSYVYDEVFADLGANYLTDGDRSRPATLVYGGLLDTHFASNEIVRNQHDRIAEYWFSNVLDDEARMKLLSLDTELSVSGTVYRPELFGMEPHKGFPLVLPHDISRRQLFGDADLSVGRYWELDFDDAGMFVDMRAFRDGKPSNFMYEPTYQNRWTGHAVDLSNEEWSGSGGLTHARIAEDHVAWLILTNAVGSKDVDQKTVRALATQLADQMVGHSHYVISEKDVWHQLAAIDTGRDMNRAAWGEFLTLTPMQIDWENRAVAVAINTPDEHLKLGVIPALPNRDPRAPYELAPDMVKLLGAGVVAQMSMDGPQPDEAWAQIAAIDIGLMRSQLGRLGSVTDVMPIAESLKVVNALEVPVATVEQRREVVRLQLGTRELGGVAEKLAVSTVERAAERAVFEVLANHVIREFANEIDDLPVEELDLEVASIFDGGVVRLQSHVRRTVRAAQNENLALIDSLSSRDRGVLSRIADQRLREILDIVPSVFSRTRDAESEIKQTPSADQADLLDQRNQEIANEFLAVMRTNGEPERLAVTLSAMIDAFDSTMLAQMAIVEDPFIVRRDLQPGLVADSPNRVEPELVQTQPMEIDFF